MRWTVVIPAKSLPAAKSRLLPASADLAAHVRLVHAIRADTAAAAAGAAPVARLLWVLDGSTGAPEPVADVETHVLVQRAPGLNAALVEAAAHAAAHWPDDGVAALVGDLPALASADLAAALAAAGAHPRAFVPDAEGTGSTLLAAGPGVELRPAFGAGSAARHTAVAARLDAAPGLRRDVDTADELAVAGELGLGPATATAVAAGSDGTRARPGVTACSS